MESNLKSDNTPSGSQLLAMLRRRRADGTLRDIFRDWKWIFSFSRGHRLAIFLYTLCGICASIVALLSGVASKYLIDCIVSRDTPRLLPLAGLLLISGVAAMAMRSLTNRLSAKLSVNMLCDVQEQVFDRLLHSRWMDISRYPTGDLLSRFSGDVATIANCAVSWLPGMVIQVFTVIATLGVVLYYDPVMALIAFASTPALLLASRRLLRKQRHFTQQTRKTGSGMAAFQSEVFRNMDTLKSFGVEDAMGQKLRIWQEEYRDVTLSHNRFTIKTNIMLSAMGTVVEYLALGYCLWRLWRGDILFGTMVLFLQQRSNLSNAFSSLISLIPTALNGSVAAERVRELTNLPKEDRVPLAEPVGGCSLTLEGVSAGYGDRRILTDVNLTAPSGQVIALVGPSGEGKSTLMRLMLGLITPEAGALYLTDEQGSRFPLGVATRQLLTYVPQGNTVLAGTVAENLRLVNPHVTEGEMIAALEDACAWEFIRELPGGLNAPVGEGGKGFSEGQAQRIAIARALVRKAPVMLLDEVTSALDGDTEQRVLHNLTRRGVTILVSTHRPSVLEMCARIYRVRDGQVTQLTAEQVKEL